MLRTLRNPLLFSGLLLLSTGVWPASAIDLLLKVDGIPGESTAAGHVGEINLLSWQWGINKRASNTPMFSSVFFSKYMDKSTPLLMKACCKGTVISNAVLTCRTSATPAVDYVKITLRNARVSSVNDGGSSSDDRSSDSFALSYDRIQFDYFYIVGRTTVTGTFRWDVKDSDGDGMPDEFEDRYGLDKLRNDAAEDKDGDGMSNLDEYLAGTDPSERNSVLKCTLVYNLGAASGTLSWGSVPGNHYRILYTDTLGVSLAPIGDYNASNTVSQITIPAASLHHFYRLQVLPPGQ